MVDLAALRALLDGGYQPMYNGRPSCPFCGNFIDAEQTHRLDCSGLVFLDRIEKLEAAARRLLIELEEDGFLPFNRPAVELSMDALRAVLGGGAK